MPLHGDITATLFIVLKGTFPLNKYHHRITTGSTSSSSSSSNKSFNSVQHWLIEIMLDKFPLQTSTVLEQFIRSILAVPEMSATVDVFQRNLDIAIQYDVGLHDKCNISMASFWTEMSISTDAQLRQNCCEYLGRIICIDCTDAAPTTTINVERDEVGVEPPPKPTNRFSREIKMLKLLMEKMMDTNNNVRIKAISSFLKATTSGNRRTKTILKVTFLFIMFICCAYFINICRDYLDEKIKTWTIIVDRRPHQQQIHQRNHRKQIQYQNHRNHQWGLQRLKSSYRRLHQSSHQMNRTLTSCCFTENRC